MRNWPSETEDQMASALDMVEEGTWTPQPLPLYDTFGDLVYPSDYVSTLLGSLASVKFTLTRQFNAETAGYGYRANVEEINIIHPTEIEIGSASHARLAECVRI